MRIVNAECGSVVPLGRLGENEATLVVFDVAGWESLYGHGVFSLLNMRNGDPAAYPVVIQQEGNKVMWEVKSGDVAKVGYGKCELVYTVNNTIAKSVIYTTTVGNALSGGGDVPEPWEDWVARVLQVGEEAREAKEQWENMTASAESLPSGSQPTAEYSEGHLTIGIPEGTEQSNPISIERLGAYIYKATFDLIPDYVPDDSDIPTGGCSAFVRGGKLHRNLDWTYDNTATFRIVCKDFEGVSFITGLDDGNVTWMKASQLPYHMVDGRNSSGIMVSTHVLFNDWGYRGTGRKDFPVTILPYYIMTHLKNMANIRTVLEDAVNNIEISDKVYASGYLIQYLVTDGSTTYALLPPESSEGSYEIVNITDNPKMTNFRWVSDPIVSRENLQNRPTGVERWNSITNTTTLDELRFTLCYEQPTRLSEFIGIDETTKDSTDAELIDIYNRAHQVYLNRSRDGELWQTVHSAIYGPYGLERLWVQENWSKDYSGRSDIGKTFVYEQTSASNEWVIRHNLAKFPSVTVVDSTKRIVVGDLTYLDDNSLKVSFSGAFSGKAYLN